MTEPAFHPKFKTKAPFFIQDSCSYKGEEFDYLFRSKLGKYTHWLSPASYWLAFSDWMMDLAISPARQIDILNKSHHKNMQLLHYWFSSSLNPDCDVCIQSQEQDKRFIDPLWNQFPFNIYSQAFLLNESLWQDASTNTSGISKHHRNVVNFLGRQMLDTLSPSNFMGTNPEVIQATQKESGQNLIRGFHNYLQDFSRKIQNLPPSGADAFQVGQNVAITPGKVIYRNDLIELIQYEPTTAQVYPEPILIVPAWIMKYYILDLSQHNSLVKYLVDQGHMVFMISWKNPTSEYRDYGLDDYVNEGIFDALKAINAIIPQQKVHTVGYCLGGTLLMLAASFMGRNNDDRLKSITLFAAQVDFKEAGELLLFIDENQIKYLESIMWEKGYLDGSQMAGTFSMLHSIDLIWSNVVRNYLLGKQETVNDLMAWDYDTTRLPYKMHSEYLRKFFLNNDLVQGNLRVNRAKIALRDVNVPLFAVSTLRDHIAPWKSVYKIHLFTESDITFVLTSGGHNAGIVSEPDHPHRNFQMMSKKHKDKYITSTRWLNNAPHYEGSWWPKWHEWLADQSDPPGAIPSMGNAENGYPPICDAPGTYVLEK